MRKLILIAGFVLASATAHAGEPRSLSAGTTDVSPTAAPAVPAGTTQTVEAPAVADTPPAAEAPKYVERPALVEPAKAGIDEPKALPANGEPAKPYAEKPARTERPRKTRYWNEARIIRELHRHGIYW